MSSLALWLSNTKKKLSITFKTQLTELNKYEVSLYCTNIKQEMFIYIKNSAKRTNRIHIEPQILVILSMKANVIKMKKIIASLKKNTSNKF